MKACLRPWLWLTLLLAGIVPAAAQTPPTWTHLLQIGGTRTDQVYATVADASGNTYQTGYFVGTTQCGALTLTMATDATFDMLLVKSDAAGNVLWARQAGSKVNPATTPPVFGTAQGSQVAVDAQGNVYVSGSFRGSVTFGSAATTLASPGTAPALFLAKYSPQGAVLWVQQLQAADTPFADASGLTVSPAGDVYVTGIYNTSLTLGSTVLTSQNASDDIFLAKYSAGGVLQWARSGGGNGQDYGYSVRVSTTNDVYVTGACTGAITLGTLSANGYGQADLFLAQYDAQGTPQWVRVFGGPGTEAAGDLALATTGEVYVTGAFSGTAQFGSQVVTSYGLLDGFLLKCTAQGQPTWVVPAGGTGTDYGLQLLVHPGGVIYVSGTFEGSAYFGNQILSSAGGIDAFVARYDTGGSVSWATRVGSTQNDNAGGLAFNTVGGLRLSVQFGGTAQFGTLSATSRGGLDVVLASFQDNVPLARKASQATVKLMLSPNPATGESIFLTGLPPNQVATIRLRDMLGRLLAEYPATYVGSEGVAEVAISALPNGHYLLESTTETGTSINRFVVSH